jgi:hypothetical protein
MGGMRISPETRMLVTQMYRDGLTYAHITEVTGVSPPSITRIAKSAGLRLRGRRFKANRQFVEGIYTQMRYQQRNGMPDSTIK